MADKERVHKLMEKALGQTPVADDGSQVKQRFEEPSKKRPDPSKNLGKFLHPSKAPKSPVADGAKNENAAGSKVVPGF
jgi:hypothetical protein